MHHHSVCEENFLSSKNFFRGKNFILIDYSLVVIDYKKLFGACRVKSHIGLIDYRYLLIDYIVV